jgi:hypothetical protein
MTVAKVWDGAQWVSIVGAQGPKGDQGAQGPTETYVQPDDPGAVSNGALWVDTDQGVPVAVVSAITQAYSITAGYTKDRAMNPQAMTLGEVATVLATLIDDMKAAGLINP